MSLLLDALKKAAEQKAEKAGVDGVAHEPGRQFEQVLRRAENGRARVLGCVLPGKTPCPELLEKVLAALSHVIHVRHLGDEIGALSN